MSDHSKIEWTDATWNIVIGCDKVSPGCDHCYAIRTATRMQANPNPKIAAAYEGTAADGEWTGRVNFVAERLTQPLHWTKPRRIFVNAQSDLFHAEVTDLQIARVWAVMSMAPQHTFQVLTKRPARMRSLLASGLFRLVVNAERLQLGVPVLPDSRRADGTYAWPLANVWLGVSVEDQKRADLRIPLLLATPAAVRFLSCEPLLGPIDLGLDAEMGPHDPGLGWVIVGGESGPGARPMHPGWACSLRDQCTDAEVAFHFKQWGNFAPVEDGRRGDLWVFGRGYGSIESRFQGELGSVPTQPWAPGTVGAEPGRWDAHGDALMRPMKKALAGRELDGRTWDEQPVVTR